MPGQYDDIFDNLPPPKWGANDIVPGPQPRPSPPLPSVGWNAPYQPPANDQSTMADYMARLSDPDLLEMHRQDVDAIGKFQQSLRALNQLKAGRPATNYDEAAVQQQGLDDAIDHHTRALNAAQSDASLRFQEMQRRGIAPRPMSQPPNVTRPWSGSLISTDEQLQRMREGLEPAND